MKKKHVIIAGVGAAVVGIGIAASTMISPIPQPCGQRCGTERWAIKTMSDVAANQVSTLPVAQTVDWLIQQPVPVEPETERSVGIETTTYSVKGILIGYKKEDIDHDLHVVIADIDKPEETMIIEFSDAGCAGVCSSIQREAIIRAKERFMMATLVFGTPTTKFRRLKTPIAIEVLGVGFFDRIHGQLGVAPNGIELHPVLDVKFIQ